jgi:glycosyltransferase involved in cell wall biosynthesis
MNRHDKDSTEGAFRPDRAISINLGAHERAQPRLRIVVPCYNEEEILPKTVNELLEILDSLREAGKISGDSSIVFVDDGSKDQTWAIIEEQAKKTRRVQGLRLSRNKGHQHALLAGLETVIGDAVVSIDADLQDDVAVIEQMLDAYRAGDDIVYGVRKGRQSDSFFKRSSAEAYYKLLSFMGVDLIHNHADYRLMSRKALNALKDYHEVNLFIRGIIPTLGFKTSEVYYDR